MTDEERGSHMHVVGGSRTGKSNFIYNLLTQDIEHGNGLCLIDPHGELYEMVVNWLASNKTIYKRRKIHLIDMTEPRIAASFNPLSTTGSDLSVVANNNMEAISTAWKENSHQTPRLKEILEQTFISLISQNMTYLEASMFLDVAFRDKRRRLDGLPNAAFWENLDYLNDKAFIEETNSARRRMTDINNNKLLGLMFGQTEHNIDLFQCMEQGDVILVNLVRGENISVAQSRFLGSLFIRNIVTETYRREAGKASPFYLYIDEAQNFLNEDISEILTQCRKFGLRMILANQDLGQIRDESEVLYKGIMGSAQTKAFFGALDFEDADALAKNIFKETNFKEVKHTFRSPTVVGHRRELFSNQSESESESDSLGESVADTRTKSSNRGRSRSSGKNRASSDSTSANDAVSEGEAFYPVDEDAITLLPAELVQKGTSKTKTSGSGVVAANSEGEFNSDTELDSEGQSEGQTQSRTKNHSRTHNKSSGDSEGLVPIIEDRITNQIFYSLNEQDRKNIERLRTLKLGEFYFSSFDRINPVKIKADYKPPPERNKDVKALKLYCAKQSYFVKSVKYAKSQIENRTAGSETAYNQEFVENDFLE